MLVRAGRSLGGHLLIISVFHIPYFCILYCSFEPGVLLWPFIAYLCIPDCSFEPGVLLWPFTEYFGERLPAETPGAFCPDFTLVSSLPCQGFYILFCNTILDEIELLTFKGDTGRGMLYASRDHNV